MPTKRDSAKVTAEETVTITRAEYDAMMAAAASPMVQAVGVAIEEGPHLSDPATREAKLTAMVEAGITADDDNITDDMRGILKEQ